MFGFDFLFSRGRKKLCRQIQKELAEKEKATRSISIEDTIDVAKITFINILERFDLAEVKDLLVPKFVERLERNLRMAEGYTVTSRDIQPIKIRHTHASQR